jgi:hypothetical protein
VVVVEDPFVASLYLREMLSQLFVYRYGQDAASPGFAADLAFVSNRVACVSAALGKPHVGCKDPSGAIWRPAVGGALVLAVRDVPAALDRSRRVWAWVPNAWVDEDGAERGRAYELFSWRTFEGKWVTSIPHAPGSEIRFKLFTAPAWVEPARDGLAADGIAWEYGGLHNDRRAALGAMPLMTIRDSNLRWGAP